MSGNAPPLEAIGRKLPPWYRENARALPWRENREPYRVWVSEIMLQQTRAEAVKEHYLRFLAALPDIRALAEVPDETLFKLWEGLGYYSRARNLKRAANEILTRFGGDFPTRYEDILSLPGIGPYTAGAIASVCFDVPTPAVDGNVLRVYARFAGYGGDITLDASKKEVSSALAPLYARGEPGVLTQSLMELGACVCVPNGAPKCGLCPLKEDCFSFQNGTTADYPVKSKKAPRRVQYKTVLILRCGDRFALQKRPAKGLLAGLWEFPNADAPSFEAVTPENAAAIAADCGCKPLALLYQTEYTHIFTHVEWRMRAFYLTCACAPGRFAWATANEIRASYALPSAFRPFFEGIDTQNHPATE